MGGLWTFLAEWRGCRGRCRSQRQLSEVVAATSKVGVEMGQLYLLAVCGTAWRRADSGGRSLLHWAAARGQSELLDWLLGELKVSE